MWIKGLSHGRAKDMEGLCWVWPPAWTAAHCGWGRGAERGRGVLVRFVTSCGQQGGGEQGSGLAGICARCQAWHLEGCQAVEFAVASGCTEKGVQRWRSRKWLPQPPPCGLPSQSRVLWCAGATSSPQLPLPRNPPSPLTPGPG